MFLDPHVVGTGGLCRGQASARIDSEAPVTEGLGSWLDGAFVGARASLLDLGVLLFLEQALKEVGDRPMRRGCTGGLATQSGAPRCQGLKPPP